MNKKGFAFIETIVTVVILSAALLYLYSSYNAIMTEEETRIYYDDPAYIYYTNYVRKFLEEYANINDVKNFAFNNSYIITIGTGYEGLFNDASKKESLEKIVESYKINQIILLDTKMFNECFSNNSDKCKKSTENLGYQFQTYINTINDTSYDYYLIVEYTNKFNEETNIFEKCIPGDIEGKENKYRDVHCNHYYASLGI